MSLALSLQVTIQVDMRLDMDVFRLHDSLAISSPEPPEIKNKLKTLTRRTTITSSCQQLRISGLIRMIHLYLLAFSFAMDFLSGTRVKM